MQISDTHAKIDLIILVSDIYLLAPVIYSLIEEIVVFSHNIVEWVFNALQDLPAALGIRKVQSESIETVVYHTHTHQQFQLCHNKRITEQKCVLHSMAN